MDDQRPRLTFKVPSYEFRDKFREAFPRVADPMMEVIMSELIRLSAHPASDIVVAAIMSRRIDLYNLLLEATNEAIRGTITGETPRGND